MNYHSTETDRTADMKPRPRSSAEAAVPKIVWSPPDLLRLLTALAHGWRWIAAAPIVALAATIGYLMFTDPTYEVGAQLMVRFGNELSAPPTVSTQSSQQVIPISKRLEDITAEVQIMKDPQILRRVVEDLGDDFFYGEDEAVTFFQRAKRLLKHSVTLVREQARAMLVSLGILPELSRLDRVIAALQLYLSVEHVSRSDVIELKLAYPDPRLGEEVLRRFIAAYLAKRESIYTDSQISTFFSGELQRIDRSLVEAEDSYSADRQRLAAWSVEDQRGLAVQRREALLRELRDAVSTLSVTRTRIAEIDRQMAAQPEWIASSISQQPNTLREALELKQYDLKLQVQAESRRAGSRSPLVEGLSEQIKDLDVYLSGQPARMAGEDVTQANPLRGILAKDRGEADMLLAATTARMDGLRRDVAAVEGELKSLEEASLALDRKARDVERLRLTRQRFQQGSDEARIAEQIAAAQISNVVVIAAPEAGVMPASPRSVRLLLLALALSVVAACSVILLLDALRPRIRSNRDILQHVGGATIVRAVVTRGRRR